jgi:D-amino-acid dehydrogenase
MAGPKKVVIVGGGIIGLSAAYYSLLKGHSVTILERSKDDYDCCSIGNAGMIVPSHFVPLAAPGMVGYGLKMLPHPDGPFAIKRSWNAEFMRWCLLFAQSSNEGHVDRSGPLLRDLNMASRQAYEELNKELCGGFDLQLGGLLMLVKSAHALEEEAQIAKRANALGIPATVVNPDEAAKIDTSITMNVAGGVYYPKDGHLSPQKLISALKSAVSRNGAELVSESEVTEFQHRKGKVFAASTSHGDFIADEFVLASGSWSAKVIRSLGLSIPLQPGKGYSLTLSNPTQLPKVCSILLEARVAVTPMGSQLRFGGTMEIGSFDRNTERRRVDGIIRAIPDYFPAFNADDFKNVDVWNGLRPCSPDGLPYVGRFSKYPNLLAAFGHAMMGVSLGPITGQLLAQLLSDEAPSYSLDLLNPDRFGRK